MDDELLELAATELLFIIYLWFIYGSEYQEYRNIRWKHLEKNFPGGNLLRQTFWVTDFQCWATTENFPHTSWKQIMVPSFPLERFHKSAQTVQNSWFTDDNHVL